MAVMQRRAVAIAQALALLIVSASALQAPPEASPTYTNDLAPLLRIEYQTEVFTKAQDYLNSLRAKPVCHQVAALDLVRSCKGLHHKAEERGAGHFEQIREAAKTEYTVRLALCEMNDAQAPVPQDCTRFLPSANACEHSARWRFGKSQAKAVDTLCYPQANVAQVKQCLTALWSGPQSWTSYSNAQQNAILVCQATHEAREKDRLIDLFVSAAEVNGQLAAANENAIKRQQAAQEAFDAALAIFSAASKDQIQKMESQGGSVVSNIVETARSALSEIYRGAGEAAKAMGTLGEELLASHATAARLKETINLLHKSTEQSRDELVTAHNTQLQTTQLSFDQMMLAIRQIMSEELAMIAWRMENITRASQQAATSLESFDHGLSRTQEILEQHNAHAQDVYGKVERLMVAFSGHGLFVGLGVLFGLVCAHTLLKWTLGRETAALFACVFAAVSATHLFRPPQSAPLLGASKLWASLMASWSLPARLQTLLIFGSLFLLVVAAVKLGINGFVEWVRAKRSASMPTLPTTSSALYNPASPPYPSLPSAGPH